LATRGTTVDEAHGEHAVPSLVLRGRYYRHYPPEAPLGETEEELELALGETVFLLVDVYGAAYDEDFVPPACARCLVTARAAISSAPLSDSPFSLFNAC